MISYYLEAGAQLLGNRLGQRMRHGNCANFKKQMDAKMSTTAAGSAVSSAEKTRSADKEKSNVVSFSVQWRAHGLKLFWDISIR